MQRRDPEDLAPISRQQRQVASEINVLTPIANHREVRDPMFDEHPLRLGDGLEQRVEFLFVRALEGTELHLRAVLHLDVFGIVLEFEFE